MRAITLEYHDVVDGEDFDGSGFAGAGPASYKLRAADFSQHLEAIAARGVAVGRVVDWLTNPVGSRPVFLTFDDGGASAASVIAERLELRGWRGHFFVTAGRIDTPSFLSRAAIRDLHRRGHVIGSHSYTHPKMMGACSPEQVLDEWRRSMATLADVLGEPVGTASVPGGFYRHFVGVAAETAGLRALFTSSPTTRCEKVGDCYILGRYTLRQWSKASTAAAIAAGSLTPRISQTLFYGSLSLLRLLAGEHYTRIRQLFWARRR